MIFWLIMGFCSFIMICIGIYAYRKKEPMWFWAGSEEEIEKEIFTDVTTYNHKNGIMWIVYGVSFLVPPLVTNVFQLSKYVFLLIEIGVIIGGFIGLMLYYEHIHEQYTRK